MQSMGWILRELGFRRSARLLAATTTLLVALSLTTEPGQRALQEHVLARAAWIEETVAQPLLRQILEQLDLPTHEAPAETIDAQPDPTGPIASP